MTYEKHNNNGIYETTQDSELKRPSRLRRFGAMVMIAVAGVGGWTARGHYDAQPQASDKAFEHMIDTGVAAPNPEITPVETPSPTDLEMGSPEIDPIDVDQLYNQGVETLESGDLDGAQQIASEIAGAGGYKDYDNDGTEESGYQDLSERIDAVKK